MSRPHLCFEREAAAEWPKGKKKMTEEKNKQRYNAGTFDGWAENVPGLTERKRELFSGEQTQWIRLGRKRKL